MDDACLPVKLFHGHVAVLVEGWMSFYSETNQHFTGEFVIEIYRPPEMIKNL